MGAMILDDNSLDIILSFVRDAPARASCKKWARHTYDAMMLESKIRLRQRINKSGSISFGYMATRDPGPEITETIAFHLDFYPKGDYVLQFSHSMQGDLADVCVDTAGFWHAEMGEIICKTSEVPTVNLDGAVVGKSKAAITFNLPIDLVLASPAITEETCPLRWEESIRSRSLLLDFSRRIESKLLDIPAEEDHDEDAPYVEVEGRRVQVCHDIIENCPEASWADLMSVRVRVGLV
jgi:hypothetical protein